MRIIRILLIVFLLNVTISINGVAQDNFNFRKWSALVRQTFIANFEELQKYNFEEPEKYGISKDTIVKKMLDNSTLYSDPNESRKELKKWFTKLLWTKRKSNKDNVFNLYGKKLVLDELNKIYNEFIKEKNINFENTFKQIANENFNPVFDTARREAVIIQATKMKKTIKLKNNEVCKIQNGNLTRKTLKNNLAVGNNIGQYFLENQGELYSIIENAIQEAIDEYNEQVQIIYTWNLDKSYIEIEIENEIIQRIKNEQRNKRYSFFDCLKSKIKRLAGEKEKLRFLNFINNTKDKFINDALTGHELKKEIKINPELHNEKDESNRIFEEKFTREIKNFLIYNYLKKAEAIENVEFKNKVKNYYDNDAKPGIKYNINSKIQVMTRNIRKSLVDTQFQEDFANKTDALELSEEEIKEARKWNSNQKNDSIKATAEQMITESNKQYIEEMNELLKERIEAKYDDAVSVYANQMDMVKDQKKKIMARPEYRTAKKAGDEEEMFKIYLQEITYVWQVKNQKLYEGKYDFIFEGSKELIHEYVRDELINKADTEKSKIIRKDELTSDKNKKVASNNDIASGASSGGQKIGLGGSGTGGGKGNGEGPGEGGGGFRVRYVRMKLEELKDFEEPPLPPNFRIQLAYCKQTLSGHSSFKENFGNGEGIGIRFDIKQSKSFYLSLYTGYSSFKYKHSDGNLTIIPLGLGFIYQIKPFKKIPIYFIPKFSLQNDLIFLESDLLEQHGIRAKETYSQYMFGLRPGIEFIYRWKKFDIGMGIDYLVTIFPNSSINLPVVGKLYNGFVYQYFLSIYF